MSLRTLLSARPRQPRSPRRILSVGLGLALMPLQLACGPDKTGSSLEVDTGAAGAAADGSRQISARWTFRSTEVDVDVVLTTTETGKSCSTSGALVMDEALAPIERYVLKQTDCATLRLTDGGDIVLYARATGHDWTEEQLAVDTHRETIELGPCTPKDSTSPVRFTLSAPDCDDGCTCAQLAQRWGTRSATLPLGKKCD